MPSEYIFHSAFLVLVPEFSSLSSLHLLPLTLEECLIFFFFFFCHKHGVGFTDGENGSWLCNNGNFMWEQPAKKRKRSEGTFLLLQHVFTSWTSPLWLAELRQLIVGSGKGAEKEGKFSWACQKAIVWNIFAKVKWKSLNTACSSAGTPSFH